MDDKLSRWLDSLPSVVAAVLVVGFLFVVTTVLPALIEAAPWEEWLPW